MSAEAAENPKVARLLERACASIILSHAFFAGAVLRKRWIACEDIPTAGTDGRDLFYNPGYLEKLSPDEVVGLLAHEACHDLGMHPLRCGARDPLLWNIACDHVVNQAVTECGLTLPKDGVPAIPDETPEHLYENPKKMAKACDCRLLMPTDAQGRPLSGAALQAAELEAKMQQAAIREAMQRAGNLPAGLARLVGASTHSDAPWESVVQRFVSAGAHTDTSWRRPNRRYLAQGLILPSVWQPGVPDFVLACDTSGSIDNETLRKVGGEVLHALATCERHGQPRLKLVWCDTEVHAQEVESAEELAPKGGGGTMYSPVFAWVREHAPDARGVVYVTDGCCDDFGPEPAVPTLWILTCANNSFHPPFGEIVCIL